MLADTGSPAFAGKGSKQGGDPHFLPGRREGAAGATTAAAAAEGLVVMVVAVLRWEISREEAALVCGAGRAEGAESAQLSEHAGVVTVVGHPAPVAAVTGEAPAAAPCGGAGCH